MALKVVSLFVLIAVCAGRPQQQRGYQQAQQQQQQQYQAPAQQYFQGNLQGAAQTNVPQQASGPGMPYNFNWAVQAPEFGNDYSHSQQSDGTVTSGEYRVLLPDTRVQIVRFTADENGYVADVSYEGTAQFPAQAASNQVNQYSPAASSQSSYTAPQQSFAPPAAAAAPAPQQTYQRPQSGYTAGRR